MSLLSAIRLSIECDECDFKTEAPPDIRSVEMAAKDFKEDGWVTRGELTLCPACAEDD